MRLRHRRPQNSVDLPEGVIGAINGHVRAGGFGLVAAAEIFFSVRSAYFAFTPQEEVTRDADNRASRGSPTD
jgi:enoyl-CoA hydratase/carnithine racemase